MGPKLKTRAVNRLCRRIICIHKHTDNISESLSQPKGGRFESDGNILGDLISLHLHSPRKKLFPSLYKLRNAYKNTGALTHARTQSIEDLHYAPCIYLSTPLHVTFVSNVVLL